MFAELDPATFVLPRPSANSRLERGGITQKGARLRTLRGQSARKRLGSRLLNSTNDAAVVVANEGSARLVVTPRGVAHDFDQIRQANSADVRLHVMSFSLSVFGPTLVFEKVGTIEFLVLGKFD